jgi:hypothetical protein
MARTRKTPQTEEAEDTTVVEQEPEVTQVTSDNSNTNQRRMKMPLSPDQVREIYAKRRTKGLYDGLLIQFLNSEDNGVSVKEQWPELADKKAQTLKQGFENSKDRKGAPEGSDQVDVIVDGEDVYLINKVVAGIEAEVEAALA